MDIISSAEFHTFCHDGTLKTLKYGRTEKHPKVFEKDGSTIIKIFYPKKRWFTSTTITPQAIRFRNNVNKLHQYGYHVPRILKMQHCRDLKTHLIHYTKIPGTDIRRLVKKGEMHLVAEVAKFVANLHQNGVIFRAIHLENLLLQPDGSFALIDISDVRFRNKSLSLYLRYRNLVHLFSSCDDKEIWLAFGAERFLSLYYDAAGLLAPSRRIISYLVKRAMPALF